MKLSISNIGWSAENDRHIYEFMNGMGFLGLEIAPTRIFPENPYDDLNAAKDWANELKNEFGLEISSVQSIWYGRHEKIFGSVEERDFLINYTERAIDFAESIGCGNIVFGCPGNRSTLNGTKPEDMISFFKEIGDYAFSHNCIIAMEAIPPVYNTNFLNTTEEALDFIKQVGTDGLRLNLDVGTMVENSEELTPLEGCEKIIHHVHISEPDLKPIEERNLHTDIAKLLRRTDYEGFVSIEVKKQESMEELISMMKYVKDVFGDLTDDAL